MKEDFSNEALYRLIEKMDRDQGVELREIRKQTTETNGRVRVLESRANQHDQEMKRLNSAVFPRQVPPVAAESGENFSLGVRGRISPKLWVALAAAGGMLLPPLVKWLSAWLDRS